MSALLDATTVKTALGITGTAYDARLAVLVASVEARMLALCQRDLTGWLSANYTETRVVPVHATITLQHWPVTAVASLTITDVSGTAWSYAVGTDQDGSDDLYIDPADPSRLRHHPAATQALVGGTLAASYTAGYAAGSRQAVQLVDLGTRIIDWELGRLNQRGVASTRGGSSGAVYEPLNGPWPAEIQQELLAGFGQIR